MSKPGALQTESGKVPRPQHTMAKNVDNDSLLDLSFLTEEEQTRVVNVLSRDAQLRRKDEGRVRMLRQTISDPSQLMTLTGDWFCDIRAGRYRSRKYGSDIVKASIRRKKKPKGERERVPWPAVVTGEEASDRAPEETVPLLQPVKPQDIQDSTNPFNVSDEEGASLQEVGKAPLEPAEDAEPSLSAKKDSEQQMGENGLAPVIITVQSSNEDLDEHQKPAKKGSTLELPYNPMKNSSSLQSLGSTTKLSGSIMSLYSDGEIGSVEVRGCIQFSLQFDSRKKELAILIIQCRDLAEAKKQRSDPYVKTYLLPDKSSASKRKTGVKKRCLDPFFDETLKYKIEKTDLQSRILNLSVWHHDVLGRNLFLGEVEIELSSWDWNQTHPVWFNLQPRTPVSPGVLNSRGKLVLSLKFVPSGSEGGGLPPTGELHIWVKEAQNLLPIRTGIIDSIVRCYVLPDDSKTSRQKTRVIKRSLNPMFNHTMVYDGFRAEDLQEACAEFTLWDKEKRSSQQLGGVRLSMGRGSSYGMVVPWMDSTDEEKSVWNTLTQKPNEWVDARLPLRTNLTPRV